MLMQGLFGACGIMALAWGIGRFHRLDVRKITILLGVQILLTWIFLKAPGASNLLRSFGHGLEGLQESVAKGTSFVFGYVGGGEPPFVVASGKGSFFILLFQALPMVVVMGAISMILFHTGILPTMIRGISRVMEKTKMIGGGLATALAGKIFLGQTDTPLLVRPYLEHFSTNELLTLMTAGMATSASTIFVLFSRALSPIMDQDSVLVHLATAAFINIMASLVIAEFMRPQKGTFTSGACENPYVFHSIMQAIARGATDGWTIMMMIAAMMIASIALVDIANGMFGYLTHLISGVTLTVQQVLGYVFAPFAWCMGISWSECVSVGSILAEKTVINEWVAITNLVGGTYGVLSPRTLSIVLYSLCAFSNLSSIGIVIACMGALAPSRMAEIVQLAPLSLMAGLLAGALSSALVSLMV
jgi:CNT family concentrative nucleoside transporter